MRTALILLAFIGLATVLACALLGGPSPQKLRVSVRFVTHTNGSDGVALSVFQVSNASPFAVLVGQSAFVESDSPGVSPEPMRGKFMVLASGERCYEEVEEFPSPNGARWRLSLDCMPHEGEVRSFIRDALPRSLRPHQAGMVRFASDWIEP